MESLCNTDFSLFLFQHRLKPRVADFWKNNFATNWNGRSEDNKVPVIWPKIAGVIVLG